jgi:MFS family permease
MFISRDGFVAPQEYSKTAFIHFLLINLISFGWICAIPIMVEHMNDIFGGTAHFFKFILFSTVVGLLTNVFFGRLVDKTSSRFVLGIGLLLNLVFWLILATTENFFALGAAFAIEGVAFSALMIARAPYFHELISKLKDEKAYDSLESDAKIGMLVSMFLCLIGSGYLYRIFPRKPIDRREAASMGSSLRSVRNLTGLCIRRKLSYQNFLSTD